MYVNFFIIYIFLHYFILTLCLDFKILVNDDKPLHMAILTHNDEDHVEGFQYILEYSYISISFAGLLEYENDLILLTKYKIKRV